MLRFISYLLGKNPYEPCKSCETLKHQLDIANRRNDELIETILSLVKPEVISNPVPVFGQPIKKAMMPWAKQRQILEEEDKRLAQIRAESAKLEAELLPKGADDASEIGKAV